MTPAAPVVPPASRNDPCPCGSGRRYKHCHGAVAGGGAVTTAPDARPAADASPLETASAAPASGRVDDALALAGSILADHPNDIDARRLRARALGGVDPAAAEAAWAGIARDQPDDAEAHFHLGNFARGRGDHESAVRHFRSGLAAAPRHAALLINLGLALEATHRLADAEACFREALQSAPEAMEPLANLAQNLFQQQRHAEALALFRRLAGRPGADVAAIWANRAVCERECRQYDAAIASFRRAIALSPATLSLRRDLLRLCCECERYEDAFEVFETLRAAGQADVLRETDLLQIQLRLAIWDEVPARRARQIALAASQRDAPADAGLEGIQPFHFQVICDEPALVLAAARHAAGNLGAAPAPRPARRTGATAVRLGFVGSHFHWHPVSRLLVNLIECLDRSRHESFAYAVGPGLDDAMRRRMAAACRGYRDAAALKHAELAELVRSDAIDVLFDLNGHTSVNLARAFALRPAPVQVNFLGFTGSMGSDAYDFLIADRYCIEPSEGALYTEQALYIDPCYLPSDARREPDPSPPRRADYGLPENGFVYCAMASTYKIVPELFGVWMGLLRAEPAAVLWLRAAGPAIEGRLRREAARRDVDPARLRFAREEPEPRYLARFRLADVFLDTVPFGSHTTVNDALYAGLPVVALRGAAFHSRASASQASAAGMDDLVAFDLAGYAERARRMRADAAFQQRMTGLARAARAGVLFDTAAYARQFAARVSEALDSR